MSDALSFLTDTVFFGITIRHYTLAFLVILAAFVLRKLLSSIVLSSLRRLAHRTSTDLDDAIIKAVGPPLGLAVIIGGIYAATAVLHLPSEPVNVRRAADVILATLVIVAATWLLLRAIDATTAYLATLTQRTESRLDDQLIPILRKSLKVFVGVLAFVSIVQNLGYSVSSLLAGLGIGGLAVALAAKDTLSNFFGSFVILIDRPFAVGDWIEFGEGEGVVEEIGFRSTRIRTFAKTEVSVPNSVLANAVINNWSRMPIRRIKMTVGVTYESSAEQMEQAVEGIKKLLREHKEVYQDFYLMNFTDFGSSSLDIFAYFFTTTTVWAEYLRIRQEVNISIMRLLESLDMEVAFPTRTVYLKPDGEEAGAAPGTPS
jgi:MscS family membrane protein